jgi:hypothetical protein
MQPKESFPLKPAIRRYTAHLALNGSSSYSRSGFSYRQPLDFVVVVCYIAFGPMLRGVLCLTQRARTGQVYGSVLLLGFTLKRLEHAGPVQHGLAMGVLMLPVVVGTLLRGGT